MANVILSELNAVFPGVGQVTAASGTVHLSDNSGGPNNGYSGDGLYTISMSSTGQVVVTAGDVPAQSSTLQHIANVVVLNGAVQSTNDQRTLDVPFSSVNSTITYAANADGSYLATGVVTARTLAAGAAVKSLNGETGAVNLIAGSGVNIVASGSNITISASGGSGGGVSSLNGETGALNIVAGTGVQVAASGSNITVSASGAGVKSLNSETGAINLIAGSGVNIAASGSNITISASGGAAGVSSLNSETGALNLVAGSGVAIVASGGNITISASGGGASGVASVNGETGAINLLGGTGVTIAASGSNITISASGGGGGSSSWLLYPIDTPPASGSAYDDEFTAGSLNAKWTVLNSTSGDTLRSATLDTAGSGYLILENPYSTGDRFYGIIENAPNSHWTMTAKANIAGGSASYPGPFIIVQGANGKYYCMGTESYDQGNQQCCYLALNSDLSFSSGASQPPNFTVSGVIYIRVKWDGTYLTLWVSTDGHFPQGYNMYQINPSSFFGSGNPTAFGIGMQPYGGPCLISYDWVRVTTP